MTGRELSEFVSQQVDELSASIDQLGLTAVEHRDLTIFLRFRSIREDREFVIRCTYLENGHHPVPRITFVNSSTLADEGNRNWPADRSGALKGTSNPPFICLPGVYEYHYQYHAGVQPLKHNLSLTNTVADIMGCLAK
jgi:hypothetical protein